jgi:hypothetical protein
MKDQKILYMSDLVNYIILSKKEFTNICEIDDAFIKVIENQPQSESDKIWLFLLGFIQGKDFQLCVSFDAKQSLTKKFNSMGLINAHSLLLEK